MSELEEIWHWAALRIPEGRRGSWEVKRVLTTPEQAQRNELHAKAFGPEARYTEAGLHTNLMHDGDCWMADNRDEMLDHTEVFRQAQKRGGRILIHGLGLGLIAQAFLALENVEHVDIVELAPEVIALVSPAFDKQIAAGRLTIHYANCFEKQWPEDAHWTVVWHDIWLPMVEGNFAEMDALQDRFAPHCDWQGCWGYEWLLAHQRRKLTPALVPELVRYGE